MSNFGCCDGISQTKSQEWSRSCQVLNHEVYGLTSPELQLFIRRARRRLKRKFQTWIRGFTISRDDTKSSLSRGF